MQNAATIRRTNKTVRGNTRIDHRGSQSSPVLGRGPRARVSIVHTSSLGASGVRRAIGAVTDRYCSNGVLQVPALPVQLFRVASQRWILDFWGTPSLGSQQRTLKTVISRWLGAASPQAGRQDRCYPGTMAVEQTQNPNSKRQQATLGKHFHEGLAPISRISCPEGPQVA